MTMTASKGVWVEHAWQELLDKDDRTSPAETPDMVLITRDELAHYMDLFKDFMLPAVRDVVLERDRQHNIEHFGPQADDGYTNFELARAAAAYVLNATYKEPSRKASARNAWAPGNWPWTRDWWKPTTRRRDLVKAAALIIAEIERLDRAAAK